MNTLILKMDNRNIDYTLIQKAATILRNGGLVAFPTETVYGLGANALDQDAVGKIFIAKGRPSDNPLIVHICGIDDLKDLVEFVPSCAFRLAEEFWPGPLTLVMKKSDKIPSIVTAGLDTVAVRAVENNIAAALIKAAGVPVAAPSANISGRPSPTNAARVIEDLYGKVDVIIDGGDSIVGLESTVLDISGIRANILRPGFVTYEDIGSILGEITMDKHSGNKDFVPLSPGMKYKHYSPEARVCVVSGIAENISKYINIKCNELQGSEEKVGVLVFDENVGLYCCDNVLSFGTQKDLSFAAAVLFERLRQADELKFSVLFCEDVPQIGIGRAIANRLHKAAGDNIIRV